MNLGAAMDVRFAQSVETFLDYLDELGLDHLELKRKYLHGHPESPSSELLAYLVEVYDVTLTLHAPFRDWNIGSFNDASRRASVEQVKATLDDAAVAGAGAVVVHGGSVPRRYPDHVRRKAVGNARRSLRECARYAAEVEVPLCLENQPRSPEKLRHTTTPDDLELMLEAACADPEALGVTLDVGHAKFNGFDPLEFIERFGDRIRVCHLHDNDGTADDHEPLPEYEAVVEAVDADFNVFEMKTVEDVARCVGEPVEAGGNGD